MTLQVPSTLFGLPLSLPKETAIRLIDFLTQIWWSNYGRSLKELNTDLNITKQFFDPIATGRKLRQHLASVSSLAANAQPDVNISGLVVSLGEDRYVLRPEGRIVIDVLQAAETNGDYVILPMRALLAPTQLIADLYRQWNGQRLEDVLKLLSGSEPLQAQPLGIALWLLVNRCTSPDRAIQVKKADADYSRRLDAALRPAVDAFASHLVKTGEARERKEFSLYSAWQLTEVARRLGPRLILGQQIYIAPGAEDAVIDILATDLRRRRAFDAEQLHVALETFHNAFKASAPQLATVSSFHEFPHETQRILSEIERRYAMDDAE